MSEYQPLASRPSRVAQHIGWAALLLFAFFALLGTSIALGALALMLIAAMLDCRRFGRALVDSRVALAVAALAFYVVARGLVAAWLVPAHAAAQYAALWPWLLLLFFPLSAWFLGGDSRRVRLVLIVALVGLLAGLARISDWHAIAGAVTGSGQRLSFGLTFLAAALYLGVALFGWIAFVERIVGTGRWRWVRGVGWVVVAGVLLEMLYLTQSRAVLLSLVVLLPCLVLFKISRLPTARLRRRGIGVFLAAIGVIVILGVFNGQSIAYRAGKTAQSVAAISTFQLDEIPETSLGQRVRIYLFGGQTWLQRPFFGWGPGIEAPTMLPGAPTTPHSNTRYPDLHDGYLEVLVRFGIVGFVLCGLMAVLLLRGLYRGWRNGRIPEDIALFVLSAGSLAALTNLSNFRAVHEHFRYFTILLLGVLFTYQLAVQTSANPLQTVPRNVALGLRGRLARRSRRLEYGVIAAAVLVAVDVAAIVGSGYLAYALRFGDWGMSAHYRSAVVIGVIFTLMVFTHWRLYADWGLRSVLGRLEAVLAGWIAVGLGLVVLAFLVKASGSYSRLWFGIWFLLASAALIVFRVLVTQLFSRVRARRAGERRVIIVGDGPMAERAVRQATAQGDGAFEVCRVVPLDRTRPQDWLERMGIKLLSPRVALADFIERAAIDEVWFCLSLRDDHLLTDFQDQLKYLTVTQRLFPDIDAYRIFNHNVADIAGLKAINLSISPMRGLNRLFKAIEDRVLAGLILLCISPVLAVIAVGVKISSSGPVFFIQQRVGWNGAYFRMLKFRSMPVDAESRTGPMWNRKSGDRATRFGSFLRRTSLDELPQFINVLKGDMSIVGPRPERSEFVDQFKGDVAGYMQKHMVKAGITGLAQINGWRGDTDLKKRIEYDLYYIEHWSLWLDLKIIALTPFKGFINENAY